jgi:LemA protein
MPVVMVFFILGLVLLVPVLMYNSLVGKRNQVHNIFGTMDAMLKKRWDLVPNIIETVKGYAAHERELFESLTLARSRAMQGQVNDDEKVQLDNAVSKLIGMFRVTVENYPQLKASDNFLHLQRTLNELEEQISAARRAYNASVTDYNNSVEMFPTNIIASMFGFVRKPLLEFSPESQQVPDAGRLLK